MTQETRKLAAIMFTDIVGYTALMGRDEEKALLILQKNRDVLKPVIESYKGKWLKEMGDGTLSSFPSAVEAVNCALEIQRSLKDESEFKLRIGIHIGDVVISKSDIFGSGVNVASRIEPLAESGGICISDRVYDDIRNKPGIEAVSLGEKHLKNVDHAVRVYALTGEGLPEPIINRSDFEKPSISKKRSVSFATAAVLIITGIVLAFGLTWFLKPDSQTEQGSVQKTSIITSDATFQTAISPDGKFVVYSTAGILYKRNINNFNSELIPGTEGGGWPFFSPDGKWLGFVAEGELRKMLLSGNQPTKIADVPDNFFGVTWSKDNVIVIGTSTEGLYKVSALGGQPEVLTTPEDNRSHRLPEFFPDGKSILFMNWPGSQNTSRYYETSKISIVSLESPSQVENIIEGGLSPKYIGSNDNTFGYILFGQVNGILAAPFDPKSNLILGTAVPVLNKVNVNNSGLVNFHVSSTGLISFLPDRRIGQNTRNVGFVDFNGKFTLISKKNALYGLPRISPNGQYLAVSVGGGLGDIWTFDLESDQDMFNQLTFKENTQWAFFSHDGKNITFRNNSKSSISQVSSDGSGKLIELFKLKNEEISSSWSPNGKYLAYYSINRQTNRDIGYWNTESKTHTKFTKLPGNEGASMISRNGKWIVYVSDETGTLEIYVESFPNGGSKRKISENGGSEPVWSWDEKKLFYKSSGYFMVMDVNFKNGFEYTNPRELFPYRSEGITLYHNSFSAAFYDIHPDGDKFVVTTSSEIVDNVVNNQINIITNFLEELKHLVPVEKK